MMRKAIGIDIGGTNIRAAVVLEDGTILAHLAKLTARSLETAVDDISTMIEELDADGAKPVGIGIPGRVNAATGEVYSGGFVDFGGIDLRRRLAGQHSRRVILDNDASMALVAEARFGAAKGLAHALMLTIGTGIGGAVLLDGEIFHGRATAGQFGHITVDMDGEICNCGRRGCIETTSSGTALGRHLVAAGLSPALEIQELLQRKDAAARAVMDAWARPLRFCIDSLVAAFDPEAILLGGGLGSAACSAMMAYPAESPWYQCPLIAAQLGNKAGVIGAGIAALEAGEKRP